MKIRNKIYENQNLSDIRLDNKQISVVWISNKNPIIKGCLVFIKITLIIKIIVVKIHWIISRSSLIKNINFGD